MAKAIYPVLRGKLTELGYTYKDASQKIGVGETTFANKMLGVRPWMMDEIQSLVVLCGVPFEELFRK